jgi:lipopolysaccharide biosynthesis glycosyltransferase
VSSYIAAHPANLVDPDQDVLNACFFDRRSHLPYIWNVISPFYFEYHPLGLTPGEVERIRSDARIIHFNGASKPWSYMSKHPRRDDYLEYLSMTEWRNFTPPDRTLPNVAKKQLSNLLPSWVARALRS